MRKLLIFMLLVVTLAGCKTVVTTTTEVRPSRYAVLEFTRPVSHDSAVAYSKRAVSAENLAIQSVDDSLGVVKAGPVKFAAADGLPALNATVMITSETKGGTTTMRIVASSPVESNETGGIDARLMQLAQRIEARLDTMIGH